MKISKVLVMFMSLLMVLGAQVFAKPTSKAEKKGFGKTADGNPVSLYTMVNQHGIEVSITDFGATVVSIKVPDRKGTIEDVTLGYDDADGYVQDKAYFGTTVGRYANRLAKGQFTIDGHKYQVPTNDGANSLHGGTTGFNKRMWTATVLRGNALRMEYTSPDGEMGFPGNLKVAVTFTLTDENELKIQYAAKTDKPTVLNLTNHTYFNLAADHQPVLDYKLTIHAAQFTPVDSTLIPTGELRSVKGTPLDFNSAHAIGERINQADEQLKLGHGYDHNFVLGAAKGGLVKAAEAFDPKSGRVLEVETDQPGIQLYTSNFLDGKVKGKGGVAYAYRTAFCLETQHYPDSPNKPKFPSTELKPGTEFHSTTVYKFSTRKGE